MEDHGKRNPIRTVPSRVEAYINLWVAVATMAMAVWFSGPTGYNNGSRVAALVGALCSGVYLMRWTVVVSYRRAAMLSTPPDAVYDAARTLICTVDRMRDHWSEAGEDVRRQDLWGPLHIAADELREVCEGLLTPPEPIRPPDPEADILPTGHDAYNRTFEQAWDRFRFNHPDKAVNWDYIAGRWPTCVCVACDPEQYGVIPND